MEEFLESITVNDFKSTYRTSFKYLPVWNPDTLYFPQDKIYFLDNKRFYEAILENENIPPLNASTWKVVQDNILLYLDDATILEALNKAKQHLVLNPCFARLNESQKKELLQILTAHYTYEVLTGELNNGTGGLIEVSKSVGDVSQGFMVPDWIKNSITYSLYANTPYGVKYATFLKINCFTITRVDTNRKC